VIDKVTDGAIVEKCGRHSAFSSTELRSRTLSAWKGSVQMLVRSLLQASLVFYRKIISPHLGAHCRFQPSCSQYAVEALEEYGILCAARLITFRILRCNALFAGGYDPLPLNNARGEGTYPHAGRNPRHRGI
jgi:putative membrane protein insertion efficiency factor